MIVSCECGAKLKIDDAKIAGREAKIRCPRCGEIIRIPPSPSARPATSVSADPLPPRKDSAPLVVVAHESDTMREMIGGILQDAGFRVEHAEDGMVALVKAEELRPQVMLVDVGLPGIYGFELCERMRADKELSRIKIILLASVYGVTRYKRKPTNLYGADDYIEKHHIADLLVEKINALLHGGGDGKAAAAQVPERPPAARVPARPPVAQLPHEREPGTNLFRPESLMAGEAERMTARPAGTGAEVWPEDSAVSPDSFSIDSSVFENEDRDLPAVEPSDPAAVEKAKRFARIIISDIALYNQEAVSEGVRNGTFYELLKNDVEEGRALYESRVPASVRAGRDYYRETIENFIAAQRKIVR